MFSWLRPRKGAPESPIAADIELPSGWLRPQSAAELLATPHRQTLMEQIWQRTAVSLAQFAALYRAPLERYAELVQHFPASQSHHHAHAGGLLDHGLEIVVCALKLRQSHLLPLGTPPENQAQQAEAWTAGIAYASLLHDIGKLATDLMVEDQTGRRWHPWHGPLRQPYRFRHNPDRQYHLHGTATGLLVNAVLGREPLDWLSGFSELWGALLHALAGQYEHAGILGELVIRADQASVARALGGDPVQALAAPRHALQRKLIDGLRYLLHEVLKLNQPEASDGWLTDDALWLVSKTVSDKLRAHLLSQGISGIPERNTTLFNILQEHGLVLDNPEGKAIWRVTVRSDSGWTQIFTLLKLSPHLIWEPDQRPASFVGSLQVDSAAATETSGTPTVADEPPPVPATPTPSATTLLVAKGPELAADSPGQQFLHWLRDGLHQKRLALNAATALLHTVDGTLFLVSPGIFRRYLQEHPELVTTAKSEGVADWQWLQKQFERLGQHRKRADDLNLWTCEVCGSRPGKRLHGYLLRDPQAVMQSGTFDNPYLRLIRDAATRRPPNVDS
ncbi:Pyruvate/2-oxoglutarate dehydrogenase complex, dihydrolipoamide acyltransferase (E2) component [Pseudomonas sp. R4-34-07]|uniref:MobH family relaxase n=1 Tax=Pseudomonas sp. R4-34-07 TaxID=658642 RepID=UPI000F56A52C|nr:MobH family relaxase [Pseudomonas sp. R4-34-07]AZF53179.1 Pyruvate/2-oxoglutarate dehydrogenase complex, dihydrolipoamide acyltransferase (E2) component [Pseudomonas sp. R4-34-07]